MSRWSSSALPSIGTGPSASSSSGGRPRPGGPRRPPPRRSRPGRRRCARAGARRRRGPAAGGRRPGGASAARSAARSRPSRAPRRWPRRSSRSCSSSRFARMLVSGVRSSCEASATNSRWALDHLLRLVAGRVELARASSRACARAPRSRRRPGAPASSARGRGWSRSRGRWRSARRSGASPGRRPEAGESGEHGAAEHADAEEEPEAADRRVEVVVVARVLDVSGPCRQRARAIGSVATSKVAEMLDARARRSSRRVPSPVTGAVRRRRPAARRRRHAESISSGADQRLGWPIVGTTRGLLERDLARGASSSSWKSSRSRSSTSRPTAEREDQRGSRSVRPAETPARRQRTGQREGASRNGRVPGAHAQSSRGGRMT